jgi:putative ABC transport system permease protein
MFSNYFKTAIRNIIIHRGYSIINIAGLAIGLAVFILIASFVDFHLSFDEFHKDADQIFSVIQVLPSDEEGEHHTAQIPAPLLPFFRDEFPEIKVLCGGSRPAAGSFDIMAKSILPRKVPCGPSIRTFFLSFLSN